MEKVLIKASEVFCNVRLPDIPCPLEFYIDQTLRPAMLKEILFENQVEVIIKFVKHDAKFIKWMMGSEEE